MIEIKKHIDVPAKFRFKDLFPYPANNELDMEYWFSQAYKDEENLSDKIYLPVTFTNFYKLHNYGQNKSAIQQLQNFVNGLDKSLKYFSLIQFDLGTLIDWSGIDIRIYSMSGGEEMSYPLPLIGQPYPKQPETEKKYVANFIGRVTHPIRQKMIDAVMNKQGYYVSTANHDVNAYTKVMAESTFTLCGRGFGKNSFRISECIRQQSVPVYISDEFVIPHNVPFDYYGVLIKEKDIDRIDEILKAIPESEIKRKQRVLAEVYEKLYTYEGTKKLILEDLKKESDAVD